MSEEKNVLSVSVKGIALYPRKENGVKSFALMVNEDTVVALEKLVAKKFGAMRLSFGQDEETGQSLLNVKSQFDVPVFDGSTGVQLDTEVYHGAEVVMGISVKEYNYKGRHGVTAYLKGIVLYKNGEEPTGATSFTSLTGNLI